MSTGEVGGWPRNIWHPQMTMHVGASQESILQTLVECLNVEGYRVKTRDDHGFRAQRVSWLDRLTLEGGTTVLNVQATGPDVLVSVEKGAVENGGRRRAARGLSAAVEEFRRRGALVQTTTWGPPPH